MVDSEGMKDGKWRFIEQQWWVRDVRGLSNIEISPLKMWKELRNPFFLPIFYIDFVKEKNVQKENSWNFRGARKTDFLYNTCKFDLVPFFMLTGMEGLKSEYQKMSDVMIVNIQNKIEILDSKLKNL